MTKQRMAPEKSPDRRRFLRTRWPRGGCEHHALIGVGDHTGHCLECGTSVITPFTLHSYLIAQ